MDLNLIAPVNAPRLWTLINAICFIWSICLAIDLIYADAPSLLDHLSHKFAYLVWNFGTTIIWLMEIGLTAYEVELTTFDVFYFHDSEYISMLLELMLALYFTIDSLILFVNWHMADFDINDGFWNATISALAYCYVLVKSHFDYSNKREYASLEDTLQDFNEDATCTSSVCAILQTQVHFDSPISHDIP